jgi:acyl-CoA thioester hydrolase
MDDLLAKYPVVIQIPVAWGEMDAMGHVNNAVYFRYFESARTPYFAKLGFFGSPAEMEVGPILGSIECRFKLPLTYPDTISVGTRVTRIEDDRFVMEHCIVSHNAKRVAAEGNGVIVAFDYRQRKKARLPEDLRQRIQQVEDSVPRRAPSQ